MQIDLDLDLFCTCLMLALLYWHWIFPGSWFLDGHQAQHMQQETLLILQPVKTRSSIRQTANSSKAYLRAVMATSSPLCQYGCSKVVKEHGILVGRAHEHCNWIEYCIAMAAAAAVVVTSHMCPPKAEPSTWGPVTCRT